MRTIAILSTLLLAGCLHTGPDRPANWQDGVPLSAFQGGKMHNADEAYDLRPTADAPLPHACAAYQDGHQESGDTCAVLDDGKGGWTLHATWDGKFQSLQETEAHPDRRTVVATTQQATVVAYWDGMARESDAVFWTE
jgi:hypothetical protein